MHIPLHWEGTLVFGLSVTEYVLDRMADLSTGALVCPRYARFVFDVETSEFLIGCVQEGGGRVAFEHISCTGVDELTWITACYARPVVPGGDTHLTLRTSTILRRLEP
eukprot:contig_31309_g7641